MAGLPSKKNPESKQTSEPLQKETAEGTRVLRQKEFWWSAYDTNSKEKSADWYFILWTIAIAGAVASFLLNNVLFGLFLIIAAFSISIYASRKPKLVEFKVSRKGVEADTLLIPLSSLSHFYIVEDSEPIYLLLQSKKIVSPLFSFPVGQEIEVDSLREFLMTFLEEQVMEVPFYQRIMDRVGF
jgi:hypothetical protein